MKLGLALPTMSNGWVISHNSPKFSPDWTLIRDAALTAERHGFDFLLSTVQLVGFAGPTKHFHETADSFAIMAGLAAVTERVTLYGSMATLTTPPPLAAKQAQTISDISGGRFGLNIVSGLEKGMYSQMGIWPGDQHFQTRYEHATEYAAIVRELWETGRSDFKGEYFQMDNCHLGPTPSHPIEIVCAGQSDRGTQFCAEFGDYQLAIGKLDPEEMKQWNDRLQKAAAAAGRTCGMHALYTIVLRDSVAEAEEAVESWRENQDYETVAGLAGREYGDGDDEATKNIYYNSDTFMLSFPTIVGDAETVAEKLRVLGGVEGVSGILMTFQDYTTDVDRFGREVVPLLRK
ncbi:MAG: LLM class flavin-dependent oxidoreductase [Pseudonocardiaceae bacterium]|nr:MAG: LLM class flavin-dependent oxidoreductase [Pseudonocardiaceae bacterium]